MTRIAAQRWGDVGSGWGAVACGGAIVAAALYTMISGAGVSAWNVWSLLFATIGAVAGAVTWHTVRARYVSREAYTTRRSY